MTMMMSRLFVIAAVLLLAQYSAYSAGQTIAYKNIDTPEVSQSWNHQAHASNFQRTAYVATCVDPAGNTFVTGYTYGTYRGQNILGNRDVFTEKYSPDGELIWIRFLATNLFDTPTACATSASGDVAISGITYGGLEGNSAGHSSYPDAFIALYNGNSSLAWVHQIKTQATTSYEYMTGVAIDSNGDVTGTGITNNVVGGQSARGGYDVFVTRHSSSDGSIMWARNLGSPGQEGSSRYPYPGTSHRGATDYYVNYDTESHGNPVKVNAFGDVYITFHSDNRPTEYQGSRFGGWDVYVAKVDNSGTHVWTSSIGSSSTDYGFSLDIDVDENVYIAGVAHAPVSGQYHAGSGDNFIAKLNKDGQRLWSRLYGHASYQQLNDIAVDTKGGVYVTGSSYPGMFDSQPQVYWDSQQYFSFVSKFDVLGNRVWTRFFASGRSPSSYSYDEANLISTSIAVNPINDDIVVAGAYEQHFNEQPDSSLSRNQQNIPKGFIFSLAQTQNCSVSDFDAIMTEINDLKALLDA
jgi:Beta-propeller repeat